MRMYGVGSIKKFFETLWKLFSLLATILTLKYFSINFQKGVLIVNEKTAYT